MSHFIPGNDIERANRGMNTRDKANALADSVCQLLENTRPGITCYPRPGMVDVRDSKAKIGYGTKDVIYRRSSIFYSAGGKDFILLLTQNATTATEWGIECWNITDNSRTQIMQFTLPAGNDWHVGFKKLYDAIYMIIDTELTVNRTIGGLTKNFIFKYESGAWTIRPFIFDITPTLVDATCLNYLQHTRPFTAVVFNNLIYGIGAHTTWTFNGITWTLLKANKVHPYTNSGTKLVVHAGYLYAIGDDKCWRTADGITWADVLVAAAWTTTNSHSVMSYEGNLYRLNGQTVWKSTDDGANWALIQPTAAYGNNTYHASVVFSGKMWVIGGKVATYPTDEIYSSTDGVTWTLETAAPGFTPRFSLAATVTDDAMWVFGGDPGGSTAGDEEHDVWKSSDGLTWERIVQYAEYGSRYNHTALVYESNLWVMFGTQTVCVGEGYSGTQSVFYSKDYGENWGYVAEPIKSGYFRNYAFTFIRRTDAAVTLASYSDYEYPPWEKYSTTVYPGIEETILTGEVSLAAGILTGDISTLFTSELSVNDYIRIGGTSKCYKVLSITDYNAATVENADSDEYGAGTRFAKMPALNTVIGTSSFVTGTLESIEDTDNRQLMCANVESRIFGTTRIPMPTNHAAAIAIGVTHMRIYASRTNQSSVAAEGTTLYFLRDIAIDSVNFGAGKYWWDRTSDSTLEGETHQLELSGISEPPQGRFLDWCNVSGRMVVGGNPDNKGFWWYGAQALDTANPEKYAGWIDLDTQYVSCDPDDEEYDTGTVELHGDRYFFKENGIFILDNSTWTSKRPRRITTTIGCAYPNTLVKAYVTKLGGYVAFFLSNRGPAVLQPGGSVKLLDQFAVSEMWPPYGTLLTKTTGNPTSWHSRNNVWARYYDNTYFVFWGDDRDSEDDCQTNYCYGFYFGEEPTSYGTFKFTFANYVDPYYGLVVLFKPLMLLVKNAQTAYALSHSLDEYDNIHYRVTRFLDTSYSQDVHASNAGL